MPVSAAAAAGKGGVEPGRIFAEGKMKCEPHSLDERQPTVLCAVIDLQFQRAAAAALRRCACASLRPVTRRLLISRAFFHTLLFPPPPAAGAPTSRLYVGNLSWRLDNAGLQAYFSQYNPTDARVIFDRATGRSKGFGFVTFADEATATTALNAFNNTEMDGRTIRVSYAQPQAPRGA